MRGRGSIRTAQLRRSASHVVYERDYAGEVILNRMVLAPTVLFIFIVVIVKLSDRNGDIDLSTIVLLILLPLLYLYTRFNNRR